MAEYDGRARVLLGESPLSESLRSCTAAVIPDKMCRNFRGRPVFGQELLAVACGVWAKMGRFPAHSKKSSYKGN